MDAFMLEAVDAMPNPWKIDEFHILLRLLLALILGGLIGFEREQSNHPAGFRTNILVCLGACLLMLLSIYGFSDFVEEPNVRVDPARLAAAVITGIGFLGAGTILFTGKSITGLTTAASLWVVAAIGLAVGAGFYFASSAVTIMVLLTLWAFNKLEKRYIKAKKEHVISIHTDNVSHVINQINGIFHHRKIVTRKVVMDETSKSSSSEGVEASTAHHTRIVFYLSIPAAKRDYTLSLLDELNKLEGVLWVSSE